MVYTCWRRNKQKRNDDECALAAAETPFKRSNTNKNKGELKMQWTSPLDQVGWQIPHLSWPCTKKAGPSPDSQPGWSSVCRTESKQGQAVARCGGFQVHWRFLGYLESKPLTHVPAFHQEMWRRGGPRNRIGPQSPSWPSYAAKDTAFAPAPRFMRKYKCLWNISNCELNFQILWPIW